MNRDIRFFLNLQILADELIEQYQDIKFYRGQDAQTLEGVYFYNSSRALLSRYVYILKEKDLQSIFSGAALFSDRTGGNSGKMENGRSQYFAAARGNRYSGSDEPMSGRLFINTSPGRKNTEYYRSGRKCE